MLTLVAMSLMSGAPVQATFEEEAGTGELEMRCDPEQKGVVRCHFLLARVEESNGACVFRTIRFDYELEGRGPNRFVHSETTPCETTLSIELTSQPGPVPSWTYAQTRSGTPVDSEFCRASTSVRSSKFVAGGGKKRAVKCTSVTMALG